MVRKSVYIRKLKAQIEEQFRTLRTNIKFSSAGGEINIIAITSCSPGEGKSTITSNLAAMMAKGGKKVVIVDCDLRKPTIHKKFSMSNFRGLTDILVQDKEIEDVVTDTRVSNLCVIPSGPLPPNPSELLGSKITKEVFKELSEEFDMVLIDTPPVLYVSDAQIISSIAQGTILVASYGKTEKKDLAAAKEIIEKAGGKILGVVINKIQNEYNEGYDYYYSEV